MRLRLGAFALSGAIPAELGNATTLEYIEVAYNSLTGTVPASLGNLVNLRNDYGSTWEGEIVIRNSVFVPAGGRPVSASLIGGRNSGNHDFGYTAYMPERITIEGRIASIAEHFNALIVQEKMIPLVRPTHGDAATD